jgi:molybdate transport system regulatory protein
VTVVSDVRIRIRIDLGPGHAIGPGKIELLEALDQSGSLSKAARALGMSYRRAWLLLKSLNELTDEPLATSVKGGAGGGGATLTASGRAMISAFRAVEAAAQAAGQSQFGEWARSGDSTDATSVRRLPVSPVVPPKARRGSPKR